MISKDKIVKLDRLSKHRDLFNYPIQKIGNDLFVHENDIKIFGIDHRKLTRQNNILKTSCCISDNVMMTELLNSQELETQNPYNYIATRMLFEDAYQLPYQNKILTEGFIEFLRLEISNVAPVRILYSICPWTEVNVGKVNLLLRTEARRDNAKNEPHDVACTFMVTYNNSIFTSRGILEHGKIMITDYIQLTDIIRSSPKCKITISIYENYDCLIAYYIATALAITIREKCIIDSVDLLQDLVLSSISSQQVWKDIDDRFVIAMTPIIDSIKKIKHPHHIVDISILLNETVDDLANIIEENDFISRNLAVTSSKFDWNETIFEATLKNTPRLLGRNSCHYKMTKEDAYFLSTDGVFQLCKLLGGTKDALKTIGCFYQIHQKMT